MSDCNTRLMDVHSALSSLLFAVQEELGDGVSSRLRYDSNLYLQLIVECRPHHRQRVVDALSHGILWGPFDYRFRCIGYPTMPVSDFDWIEVSAIVDLQSNAPSGRIDFNETPSRHRERAQRYAWGYRA